MSAVTRPGDPLDDQPDDSGRPDHRLPTDDPTDYAPKWLREVSARQRKVVAMRPHDQTPPRPPRLDRDDPAPPRDNEEERGFRPPPWPREPRTADRAPPGWPPPAFLREPVRLPDYEGDRDIRQMWRQQSLTPSQVPEPPVRERPPGLSLGGFLRFGGAIGAAALAALVVVEFFATPKTAPRQSSPSVAAVTAPTPPTETAAPAAPDNAPVPLLRTGDTTVPPVQNPAPAPAQAVETQSAVTNAGPPQPAPDPASIAAPPSPPAIDAEELARMVKLGEDFVGRGDYAAARVILQRAADAGDARAALVLGGTFDPTMLRQLKVMGFKPDIATARVWYQKAAQAGSAEAGQRLAALATLGNQ